MTTWRLQMAHDAFRDVAGLWDQINRTQGNHILLDSLMELSK